MRNTILIMTLLLATALVLTGCSEYSDEDYALLEAKYERQMAADKAALDILKVQYYESLADVNNLTTEVMELNNTMDGLLDDYLYELTDIQQNYDIEIAKLNNIIEQLDYQTANNYIMVEEFLQQTLDELAVLQAQYDALLREYNILKG